MRSLAPDAMHWLARRRQLLLFLLLIATMAVGPVLSATSAGGAVLDVCLGLTLLATTLSPMQGRRAFLAFVVLAIALGLAPARATGMSGPLIRALWAAIAIFAAVRALRYAMSSRRVDVEHLLAALNAYLLVGVFLGAIWFTLEEAIPGSLLAGGASIARMTLPDGIYFSFVTLATLGYGDIAPATPVARGLAVFEAVFGQLYLAVMVARLVSLRIAGETRDLPP